MNDALLAPVPTDEVDEVVARFGHRTGDVLGILEEVQKRHPLNYLPRETLALVAERTGLSASQIYGVATFYSFFNLRPQGRHTVTVCRGTACHTRGSKDLLDTLRRRAGAGTDSDEETFTTPDGQLTVRVVACFGQCALAPVVAADERIHGHVTDQQLNRILESIQD